MDKAWTTTPWVDKFWTTTPWVDKSKAKIGKKTVTATDIERNMKYIRIGNDISITWTILRNGQAEDYSGRDLVVRVINPYGVPVEAPYSVSDNVVSITFWGHEQSIPGVYTCLLVENEGEAGMTTVDVVEAFKLVEHTYQEGGTDSPNVETDHVVLTSELTAPANGWPRATRAPWTSGWRASSDPRDRRAPRARPALKGRRATKAIRATREQPARRATKVTRAQPALKGRKVTRATKVIPARLERPALLGLKARRAKPAKPARLGRRAKPAKPGRLGLKGLRERLVQRAQPGLKE